MTAKTYSAGGGTKMNIIQATGELAADLGFDNVTTRMVADRSGENIGSIHYHFGGKDALFEAVVREAIDGCCSEEDAQLDALADDASPEELARMVRVIVSSMVTDMFRSERPGWHVPVIYSLIERDDELYELFDREVMAPNAERLARFFRIIQPDMDDWDVHLHKVLIKMPIFAHGDYMKAMLRFLKADHYSAEYLQRMEDMVVKQTQLLLGLPLV